jgi:hypothetical protein
MANYGFYSEQGLTRILGEFMLRVDVWIEDAFVFK